MLPIRAIAGTKTLIVDLDLRNPSIHKLFDIPRSPGIIEFLSGDADLGEVVHEDPATGANVIAAGFVCWNPTDILMAQNLYEQIRDLVDQFDLVIFDSAPIKDFPDTRLVLDKIDVTVFVAHWAHTKRSTVNNALARLMHTGDHFLGVALNRVDVKRIP